MKSTAKIFLDHYNEIPALEVGFICHVHVTSPTYLYQAFPDTKYIKKINMKRDTLLVDTSHVQVWYYIKQADL